MIYNLLSVHWTILPTCYYGNKGEECNMCSVLMWRLFYLQATKGIAKCSGEHIQVSSFPYLELKTCFNVMR